MADNGQMTVDEKVEVVLFCAETKSVVATQRCFCAHFGTSCDECKGSFTRGCEAKRWSH